MRGVRARQRDEATLLARIEVAVREVAGQEITVADVLGSEVEEEETFDAEDAASASERDRATEAEAWWADEGGGAEESEEEGGEDE